MPADKQKLKDMLDNIVDGNTEEAQVDFHSYLRDKMQDHLGTGTPEKVDLDVDTTEIETETGE